MNWGGSWQVYGLQDQGFSNDVREGAGSFRIVMYGYNYDELYEWAEQLKAKLLTHRRIKEVLINSEFSWWKDDYQEFYFNLNKARLTQEDIQPIDLFASINPVFGKGHLYRDDRRQRRDRETETLLPPVTGIRCVEHAVCSTNY